MGNLFLNIPVPAANGAGVPVDVSAMGKTKSLVCGGGFQATVNVEYSTDDVGAGPWAPLATFQQSGNLIIDVAARWLRAVTSSYKGGAPNLDVGSSDSGSVFALLTADGAAVDVSALPLLKTVVAPAGFVGNVEISEDGVSWAQIFSFQQGGGQTRSVAAQFARVIGGADVWIGGANADGAGSEAPSVERLAGDGNDPPIALTPDFDVSYITGSGEGFQDFTMAAATRDGHVHAVFGNAAALEVPNAVLGLTVYSFPATIGSVLPSIVLVWDAQVAGWRQLGASLNVV